MVAPWLLGRPSTPRQHTVGHIASEICAAAESQPGNLGTSLVIDLETGTAVFESFWASDGALVESADVIAASLREAAQRADGTVTRQRYEILVFEREVPWSAGQGVRVARMNAEPAKLSRIEDAVAWYGDTAVPMLAETSGFCAALLGTDWDSARLISETVWRDPHALTASRSTATAVEVAAAQATDSLVSAVGEYRLAFSSARPD